MTRHKARHAELHQLRAALVLDLLDMAPDNPDRAVREKLVEAYTAQLSVLMAISLRAVRR